MRGKERLEQIKSLVGGEWLNLSSHNIPIILCGDFNEGTRSPGHLLLKKNFKEVKSAAVRKSLEKTLFSCLPLFEVDHIFFNGDLRVEFVDVPKTPLTKIASDHLPLLADFILSSRSL